ncbi:MAG: hypothetical protein KZQ75_10830 [Candidatus Thiodiazotropha sp. (ex Myrtea spinifera)]|nr:hypothetical protein [Candidatus Thiodiazotropha sp. (ex Myrtea spinifera)]
MSDDDFKVVFKSTINGGGTVGYRFPVPKELEPIVLSSEYGRHALEYYLLGRHAYFHRMQHGYLMNCFWCVEYLLLAILVLKITQKDELKNLGGYHSLTSYWGEVKKLLNVEDNKAFIQFDSFISLVQGYYSSRYPSSNSGMEMTTTGKPAQTRHGEDGNLIKPEKVTYIDIDKFDHFVNFFLFDVTGYNSDASGNLMEQLAAMDSREIYLRDNKYSIIYPNRKYSGELERKDA